MSIVITIVFNYDGQFWTHVYNVDPGCTLMQLKEQMLQPHGTKQDADAFELQLRGQRVSDAEQIFSENTFEFVHLGKDEGSNRASEDEADQRKREREKRLNIEASKKKVTARPTRAAAKKAAAQPVAKPTLVQVLVKHADREQGSQVTVEVMSNCTTLDVRKAVMELLDETKMSEVKIVKKQGQSFLTIADGDPIGTTREFASIGRKLELPTGIMVVNVTIDAELDFKSELEVERGTPMRVVKEMLAALDPTGSTTPESFGVGLATPGGGPAKALPDTTLIRDKHKDLQVTEPYKEPPPEQAPPPEKAAVAVGQGKVDVIPGVGIWKVVGGATTGGILVRMGEDKKSPELERLAPGSIVTEMHVVGERLHFKKIHGEGPDEGWVSLSIGGKELVQRCPVDSPEVWTVERAISLQWELKEGFSGEAFQSQMNELNEEFPERKGGKYNVRKNNLTMAYQVGPLSRYGFEGSARGVGHMLGAFAQHNWHWMIQQQGAEIGELLG